MSGIAPKGIIVNEVAGRRVYAVLASRALDGFGRLGRKHLGMFRADPRNRISRIFRKAALGICAEQGERLLLAELMPKMF